MSGERELFSKLRYGFKVKVFKDLLFSQAVIYLDNLYDNLLWIVVGKNSFLIDLCFSEISCYSLELELEIKLSSGYKGVHLPKYILVKEFNIEVPLLFEEYQSVEHSSFKSEIPIERAKRPSIFSTIENYIKIKKSSCNYSSGFSRCLKKMRLELEQIQSEKFVEFSENEIITALNKIEDFYGVDFEYVLEKEISFTVTKIMTILKIIYCKINLYFLRSLKGGEAIAKFKKIENFLEDKVISIEGKLVSCFEALTILEDKKSYMIPEYKVNEHLPLIDYFCFSSHNTYLTGNQLTSDSKVSRYIEDLRKGIKCVELDVHNKGDNEPIITHAVKGKGFCKPIQFRHTIEAIDEFLEQYPNHYPVILSIENHATRENQDLMYNIIRKEFPKNILIPHDTTQIYTLSQIKGKVIFKNSCAIETLAQFSTNNELPKIANHPFLKNKSSFSSESSTNIPKSNGENLGSIQNETFEDFVDFPETENENYKKFLEKINKYKRLKVMFNQKIDQTSYLPVEKIVQITCLFKASKGIDTQKPSPFECCSMQNTKIVKTEKQKIVSFSKQAWIRSYPEGTEIYSNNYDFLELLSRGIQIIALNTQTNDDYAIMLNSYFRAGRNSNMETIGYVEKPEYLRTISHKNGFSQSYPQKRNYEFTFYTKNELEFTLYSLDKSKNEVNKVSEGEKKVNFSVDQYNEAFLMIKIGKKYVECLPLRFLPYDKKNEVLHKNIVARNYEFEDTGMRLLATFRWY